MSLKQLYPIGEMSVIPLRIVINKDSTVGKVQWLLVW